MGIGEFIRGQFVDVIEHIDEDNKLLVYKYTRPGNEVKQGASLIVRNGQVAAFIHMGRIADIFGPGTYTLNTGNLPILSSLKAFVNFFNSPIKSDLYFINTTRFINNVWETKNPILLRDRDMNMVRITAFGNYSFRVSNVEVFLNEVFGARHLNMTYDIVSFMNSFVSEAVALALGESDVPILDMAVKYRNMSQQVCQYVNERCLPLGFEIPELVIENVSLPEEVEKLIDEQSGIGMASKDMGTFMQYQTARAMRDASKQKGGLAGLGAGYALGNKMVENLSQQKNGNESEISGVEKIREYKALLDENLITEEEFTQLKRKILGI